MMYSLSWLTNNRGLALWMLSCFKRKRSTHIETGWHQCCWKFAGGLPGLLKTRLCVRRRHSLRVMSSRPDLEANGEVIMKHTVQSGAGWRVSRRRGTAGKPISHTELWRKFTIALLCIWCEWDVPGTSSWPCDFADDFFLFFKIKEWLKRWTKQKTNSVWRSHPISKQYANLPFSTISVNWLLCLIYVSYNKKQRKVWKVQHWLLKKNMPFRTSLRHMLQK